MDKSKKIQEVLEKGVKEKTFPGAVVGFINDRERQIIPVGRFEYDPSSSEVREDTLYDTASITKSVPVRLLALKFIEEGKLSLDDKVSKYITELEGERKEKGIIKDLMTYTYILKKNPDPNFTYENQTEQDIFEFLFKRDFEYPPGTHYQYSNTPANLIAIILERISGERLYNLAKRIIFNPLEMKNSTFCPQDKTEIPPTEIVSWRGKVQGEVHDETASIMQRAGFQPGCSGLFSNVLDLLNVTEMLLNNGTFKGMEIFKPKTIKLMETNALEDIGQSASIGWELDQKFFMGNFAGENTFGKTGFTGTHMVIDRKTSRALVMLSNSTFPERPENRDRINEIRREISNIILDPHESI